MVKNFYILIIAVAIIASGAWFLFLGSYSHPAVEPAGENAVLQTQKKQAILTIDYGDGEPKNSQVNFAEGAMVFDILKEEAEEKSLGLKTKTYEGTGVLVEAIGEKENGQDGKYWLYYVNGEMPMVPVDKMRIKEGDKIEFKFEKSKF